MVAKYYAHGEIKIELRWGSLAGQAVVSSILQDAEKFLDGGNIFLPLIYKSKWDVYFKQEASIIIRFEVIIMSDK